MVDAVSVRKSFVSSLIHMQILNSLRGIGRMRTALGGGYCWSVLSLKKEIKVLKERWYFSLIDPLTSQVDSKGGESLLPFP